MTGRPFHPQRTGKVERFQQTLKKWLRQQPLAGNLSVLQRQLDEFCRIYNYERPDQGIGRVTLISRWQAAPGAGPADTPLEHPTFAASCANDQGMPRRQGQRWRRSTNPNRCPLHPRQRNRDPRRHLRQRLRRRPTGQAPQDRPNALLPALRQTTRPRPPPRCGILTVTDVPRHLCHRVQEQVELRPIRSPVRLGRAALRGASHRRRPPGCNCRRRRAFRRR